MKVSCGSWIVVRRATGETVAEIFSARTAAAVNRAQYDVLCAYQYLTELNRRLKATPAQQPTEPQ
jgi:hypothetical protein